MAERDAKGRFIKGQSGNPEGRSPKERELQYREIMLSACTPTKWKDICDKAVFQATRGDSVARKFLADYIMGPPPQKTELTGEGGGAIQVTWRKFIEGDNA